MDLSGEQLEIYSADPDFRKLIFDNLSKLTDDKLVMDKNGKITIDSYSKEVV